MKFMEFNQECRQRGSVCDINHVQRRPHLSTPMKLSASTCPNLCASSTVSLLCINILHSLLHHTACRPLFLYRSIPPSSPKPPLATASYSSAFAGGGSSLLGPLGASPVQENHMINFQRANSSGTDAHLLLFKSAVFVSLVASCRHLS